MKLALPMLMMGVGAARRGWPVDGATEADVMARRQNHRIADDVGRTGNIEAEVGAAADQHGQRGVLGHRDR